MRSYGYGDELELTAAHVLEAHSCVDSAAAAWAYPLFAAELHRVMGSLAVGLQEACSPKHEGCPLTPMCKHLCGEVWRVLTTRTQIM